MGKELIATVMVEIDNPVKRSDFLKKMGGFEETFNLVVNENKIDGKAELDVDRTTADGKASSVQFVHFQLDELLVKNFRSLNADVRISINHSNYMHSTRLNQEIIKELSYDFT